MNCDRNNLGNNNIEPLLYDEIAVEFLNEIVIQINNNNPNFYNECYCDTNNNDILDPLELSYLEWEFSNNNETNYLIGIEFIESGKYIDSIPSSIQNINSLKNITIQNSQITEIPIELFSLANLNAMNLSNNEINFIPNMFDLLDSNFRIIDFSNNNLLSIPSSIFNLPEIQFINFNNNMIESLPLEICNLNPVISVSLLENNLCIQENVPECVQENIEFQTKCYSEIDIIGLNAIIDSNNILIEDCDCDINFNGLIDAFELGEQTWQKWNENAKLIELKVLGISEFPQVSYESFTALEDLDLSNNNIDFIYSEISYLTALENLNLSHNLLITLPEELSTLSNLNNLFLNNNDSLNFIPSLDELEIINISYTNLFCENGVYDESQLEQFNNSVIVGAYMQYCYMEPDLAFLNDLIIENGFTANWDTLGIQVWGNGRLFEFELKNNVNIDSIPPSIGNLSDLTILNFSGNNIHFLSDSISNLSKLRILNLSNNKLDTIQFSMSNFNELTALDFSSNDIYSFPESVCDLPIIEINFENNRICDDTEPPCTVLNWDIQIETQRCKNANDIAFINQLMSENDIDNDYNNFGVQSWQNILNEDLERLVSFQHIGGIHSEDTILIIPSSISGADYLDTLELVNHSIEIFPDELFTLSNLSILNMQSNNLTEVASLINELQVLTQLNLSQNNLKKLPNEIAELETLIKLDLSDNELDSLPELIGELLDLEYLDISDNLLTNLPTSIEELSQLIYLDISGNQIDSIPESWCVELSIDWDDPNQFIFEDNNLCNDDEFPSCITIDLLNQNCD
ncbi:MAG: hypothetical protein H8E60_10070 [Candidatus Marinimicrobia bacterium]|nr:hypothetical protein [Candidatus Neomarinimicrobiota bacterium]